MKNEINVKRIENTISPELLKLLYGEEKEELDYQIQRYSNLLKKYYSKFDNVEVKYFSSPGRTELGGNHTDHNNGSVLAASINLDSIAIASKNSDSKIVIYSDGYDEPFEILLDILEPINEEFATTYALIRGIASRFVSLGFNIGGFNAYISSNVLIGSGLSSSASIEVLIGTILNSFYNNNIISPIIIAMIGQYAENKFFGKPCGLMDQIACSLGGIVEIDFKIYESPKITNIKYDISNEGYNLLIVNTGDNHTDLTAEYAAIPNEMRKVAELLGGNVLREIPKEEIIRNISILRQNVSDRAILRAIHFVEEQTRVNEQVVALKEKKFDRFLKLVRESGNSSFKWLQNIYSAKNVQTQGISLALLVTELFFKEHEEFCKNNCAVRVHGGGFAGTIQVFVKKELSKDYKILLESIFGNNSVQILNIRKYGAVEIDSLEKIITSKIKKIENE